MSERVMLSWNIPNWITVILMVAFGYLLVSLAMQLVRGRGSRAGSDAPPGAGSLGNFMGIFGGGGA